MTTYEELIKSTIDKFETEIFPLLLNYNLIHKSDAIIEPTFPKKLDRLELQKESIEQKITLLRKYISDMHKPEDFNKRILYDLTFILAQSILGYYEIFKEYMKKTLNLKELEVTKENPTFSEIVTALGKYKDGTVFHYDGISKLFNVNMRNTLVHDNWWLNENNEFTFKEPDETKINLNIGELHGELASINAIVLSYTENYMINFDSKNYENFKRIIPQLFPNKKSD